MRALQVLRGGLLFDYKTRMMARFTNRVLLWGIMGYVLLVGGILGITSRHTIMTLWLQVYATFLGHIGFGTHELWRGPHGGFSAAYFLSSQRLQSVVAAAQKTIVHDLVQVLCLSGIIYFVIMFFILRFFSKKALN